MDDIAHAKNEIISKVYHDPGGYGSIKETFQDAKKNDKTITLFDVKKWIESNTQRKQNLAGFNSYVAPKPFFEYQVDIFFTGDWDTSEEVKAKQIKPAGMVIIDVFTKYIVVIPLDGKNTEQVSLGIVEGFHKMGHKPEVMCTDDESAFSSEAIQKYLSDNNIKHIVVRNHPHIAERAIRTMKNLIYDRLKNTDKQWTDADVLYASVLKYNNKMIHTSTKMTPSEAIKPGNQIKVKVNLEMRASHTRKYPEVKVGDEVRMLQQKTVRSKERVGIWQKERRTVALITESHGQKFYHVTGWVKPVIRADILLVR
jgi:hypothetical protein